MPCSKEIAEIQEHLDGMRARSGPASALRRTTNATGIAPHSADHDQTLEELAVALEKLKTANQELHTRQEKLDRAQLGILAERQRYADLFAFAPIAYLVSDRLGVIGEANQAAGELFWVRPEQLVDKSLGAFVPRRAERTRLRLFMNEVREFRGVRALEVQLCRARDGAPFPARLRAAAVRQGGVCVGIRWSIQDTEQKRAKKDHILAALFDAATDSIIWLDLAGAIQELNPAAEEMYGFRSEALRGQPASVLFAVDQRVQCKELLRQLALSGSARKLTAVHMHRLGSHVHVEVSVRLILDGTGDPKSIAMFVHDISSSHRIEALFRERAEALGEADRKKNLFLGLLAHELRSPLAAVWGAVELMAQPGVPEPDAVHALAIANRQLAHMRRLLDDLLDVTRISTGKLELRKGPLRSDELLADAMELGKCEIERRRQELVISLPEEPLSLWGDRVRLTQVLVNLLNNAAKYGAPGSKLDLCAAREGDWFVIRLRDSGQGVSPRLLPRVFEKFIQGENLRGGSNGGLGLGLSLVDQIVRLHGGLVIFSSLGEAKGATVTVELPLARDAE